MHYKNKNQKLQTQISQKKQYKKLSRYFHEIHGMTPQEAEEIASHYPQQNHTLTYITKKLNEHDKKKIEADNQYMKKHHEELNK